MKHFLILLCCSVAVVYGETTYVNDQQLDREIAQQTDQMLRQGLTAPLATLRKQLDRTRHPLRLENPPSKPLTAEQLYQRCRDSVVIIGGITKGADENVQSFATAVGFLITRDGVMVTNYHVIDRADKAALGVRTADGKFYGIKEVLAASQDDDIAIVRLNGSGFTPLPIAPDAPVGSPVTLISHPANRFYSVTTGVVSRYSINPDTRATMLDITADFGKGSSGAPILNDTGAVVGMVCMTQPLAGGILKPDGKWVMVVKKCATSRAILSLLTDHHL